MDAVVQFLTTEALSIVPVDLLPPGTPSPVVWIPAPSIQIVENTVDSEILVSDGKGETLYQQEIEGEASYRVQLAENSIHKTTVVPHLLARNPCLAANVKEFLTNDTLLEACMPVVWGTDFVSAVPKINGDPTIVCAAVLICCNGCAQLRVRAPEVKEWTMPVWSEEELRSDCVHKPKQKKQDPKSKQKRQARAIQHWARVWRKWRHKFASKMREAGATPNLAVSFLAQRFAFAQMSVPYERCAFSYENCLYFERCASRVGLAQQSAIAVSPPLCY